MIRVRFAAEPDGEIDEGTVADIHYEFCMESGVAHSHITEHYIHFLRAMGYVLDGPNDLRAWTYAEDSDDD